MKWLRAIALPGAVFLLALGLRIGSTIDYEHHHPWADRPVIDEASYERWALEIAGGDWVGEEVFFQEPLYPYWLGTFYATWPYTSHGELQERILKFRLLGRIPVPTVLSLFGERSWRRY